MNRIFIIFLLIVVSSCTSSNEDKVVPKSSSKELLTFSFLQVNNSSTLNGNYSLTIVPNQTSYILTLPPNTNIQGLKPTFTLSNGAVAKVGGVEQISGSTPQDFSKAITYQIVAEDGSIKDFSIEASRQSDIALIDNAAKNFISKYNLPGLSLAILKDEKLIYAKGFGLADKEKNVAVNNETIFRIGSVSKQITAIAVLKLVDEGKLTLDQKVFGTNGILGKGYGSKPYNPQLEQITVRQILEHTAGGDAWNHLWNYPTRIDPFYQPEWITYSQADVISATLDNRPVTQTPGTKFVYSNVGYNILGRVIEKVSGTNYEKYVQDNILIPIGISVNSMRVGKGKKEQNVTNEATYYNPYGGYDQPYAFPLERMDAHGGWISTSINLAKLMSAIDGQSSKKDILSSKSIAEMYKPSQVSLNQLGGVWGYGLGWYISNGQITHDGSVSGSSATWWKLPSGYSYVVLVNSRSAEANYFGDLESFLLVVLNSYASSIPFMKGDQFDLYFK